MASEGDVYTFADITTNVAVSNNTMSVSATCKNVTGALNLLNWFFTDEGSEITNYGIEGETFERADNGDVVYTELITDNPDGWSKANARTLYCFNQVMPQLYVSDSFFYLYDDITLDAISNWNSSSSEHTIPDLEYTSEEADIINQITAEIGTYANEQMLQFVTGAKSLTDENWTSYTAEIERMNLAEALDLIQDAYDRFTAR